MVDQEFVSLFEESWANRDKLWSLKSYRLGLQDGSVGKARLPLKPDCPSLIAGTQEKVERETWLHKAVFWPPHALLHAHTHTHLIVIRKKGKLYKVDQ